MPRKRARYKKLAEQLRAAGNNPESGSRVDNYLKYITGQKELKQDNTIPVKARELYQVALHPFAVTPPDETANSRYLTTMSAYSIKGLKERTPQAVKFEDFGVNFVAGGEQNNPLFYPALLKAKYKANGAQVQENKTSGITGEKYKYEYGRTFSLAFGRTTTKVKDAEDGAADTTLSNSDELDVLSSLREKLTTGVSGNALPVSMSYEPELFKTAPITKSLVNENPDLGTFSVS